MDTVTITRTMMWPEIKVPLNDEVAGIVNTLQFSDGDWEHKIERVK